MSFKDEGSKWNWAHSLKAKKNAKKSKHLSPVINVRIIMCMAHYMLLILITATKIKILTTINYI